MSIQFYYKNFVYLSFTYVLIYFVKNNSKLVPIF